MVLFSKGVTVIQDYQIRPQIKTDVVNEGPKAFRHPRRILLTEDTLPRNRSFPLPEVSKGIKIAIAEDEKSIQNVYSLIIQNAGFVLAKAFDNGKSLSEFVGTNTDFSLEPDIVITDLRMPVMDGIEAAKVIRAIKPKIKIILATAYDVPADSVILFDAILRKPFGKKEMIEAVYRSLKGS